MVYIMAENMYAQVDSDGHNTGIFYSIIDFNKDDKALTKCDLYITTKSGCCCMMETTSGWNFLIQYKYGS